MGLREKLQGAIAEKTESIEDMRTDAIAAQASRFETAALLGELRRVRSLAAEFSSELETATADFHARLRSGEAREPAEKVTTAIVIKKWRALGLFGNPLGTMRAGNPVFVRTRNSESGRATYADHVELEQQLPDFGRRLAVLTRAIEGRFREEGEPEDLKKLRSSLEDQKLAAFDLSDSLRSLQRRASAAPLRFESELEKARQDLETARHRVAEFEDEIREQWAASPNSMGGVA